MPIRPTIDPSLFTMLGQKLYSSHPLSIVVRELLQNSRDACIKANVEPEITIMVDVNNSKDIWVTCEDNGCGMTNDELLTKFLCLGGSGKTEDASAVGGFGIASAALLRNPEWSVRTSETYVDHTFFTSDKELEALPLVQGTTVKVHIVEETYSFHIQETIRIFVTSDTTAKMIITRDGASKTYTSICEDNKHFESLVGDWGSLFSMQGEECEEYDLHDRLFIRLNGLTQYTSVYEARHSFILDLYPDVRPSDKEYPLNMSRESLTGDYWRLMVDAMKPFLENPDQQDMKRFIETNKISDLFYDGRFVSGRLGITEELTEIGVAYSEAYSREHSIETQITDFKDAICRTDTAYESLPEFEKIDARILKLWTELLRDCTTVDVHFGIGFTQLPNVSACRNFTSNGLFFQINPENFRYNQSISSVLFMHHTACHEIAHNKHMNHTDDFMQVFTTTYHDTLPNIVQGMKYYLNILKGK